MEAGTGADAFNFQIGKRRIHESSFDIGRGPARQPLAAPVRERIGGRPNLEVRQEASPHQMLDRAQGGDAEGALARLAPLAASEPARA